MEVKGKIEWFKTWPEARARVNQLRASGLRVMAMDMGDHITVITRPPTSSQRHSSRAEKKVMPKDCPKCGLINPTEAERCDCGYDFVTRQMRRSYLRRG